MASRPRGFRGLSRNFREDPHLQQYFLNKVIPTEKTLGVGSYGSVVEVEYNKVSCAAKHMHELLMDPLNEGVQNTIVKYQQECQLMAGLRHPNIAQFLGLCFLEGSELPLLVMERLEMSVDDLLECAPNIPLPVKVSILTDTCSGLVYLHGRPSPIVHRDLTARNVLLTSSLTAKITDMGNSRILDMRPARLAQTMSKLPGTLVYMPPEALTETHRYGSSLDMFSFGHLALYVLTQTFPGDLLSATQVDPHNPGRVIGRTEVERREVYMKKLEDQLLKSHPILVEIVTNCLHNDPQTRPTAEQLLGRLQPIKKEMSLFYGEMLVNMTHVLHVKESKEKDKRIRDLEKQELEISAERTSLINANSRIREEKEQLQVLVNNLKVENNQLKTEKDHLKTEKDKLKAEKDQYMALNYQLMEEKDQLTAEYKEENNKLKAENNQQKVEKQKQNFSSQQFAAENIRLKALHQLEKGELQMEVEQLRCDDLKNATTSENKLFTRKSLIFPLELDLRRGVDMPVAMGDYIQSVVINDTVYNGGGWTDRGEDGYIVMAYNTQSCQWHTLPPYSTRWFAMITINNKLVVVGGMNRDHTDSSELGEWQSDSNQWTHPFPPMSTPRWMPSATSYKYWLVVAGGYHRYCLQTVEVLDVSNMQWSTGPSTPIPWSKMKSTTIVDIWFLMGGACEGLLRDSPDVFSVSLEALVSHSSSHSSNIWYKLPSLNCTFTCPFNIRGSLLAVGGKDMKSKKCLCNIQRYVPETNTWVQAGQLPHAVCNCTCIMTSDKVHVMGGYDGNGTLKKLFTSTIN